MSSTTHDFYLGRGQDAEWLGSVRLGTRNGGGLDEIRRARSAGDFIILVALFLRTVEAAEAGEVTFGNHKWPWPWPTSHGTDYTHALDTGVVWTARRGDRWSLRGDESIPQGSGGTSLEFPHMRNFCGYTGIDASDTTTRCYGPLLGDTYRHDLSQLGQRILTDLTGPPSPGEPAALTELRARPPPHLRYTVAADATARELVFEIFGWREGEPAVAAAAYALAQLPGLYGWTDPSGGPLRFGVRVLAADDRRHTTYPALADSRARAVFTAYSSSKTWKGHAMSSHATPADPAAAEVGEPRSAAEHYAAAESLFAQARAIYPDLSSRAYHQNEYKRCLDWARLHLRLAEAATAGAGLVFAHRNLLANSDVRLQDIYVGAETQQWNTYFKNKHDAARKSA